MWMAIVFSVVGAIMKRELSIIWDETVAYAAVLSLVGVFTRSAPG